MKQVAVSACRGRHRCHLGSSFSQCVLISVCCPQIKTHLSGMDSWSSSFSSCLWSLWLHSFTCAGRTSECDDCCSNDRSRSIVVFHSFELACCAVSTLAFQLLTLLPVCRADKATPANPSRGPPPRVPPPSVSLATSDHARGGVSQNHAVSMLVQEACEVM